MLCIHDGILFVMFLAPLEWHKNLCEGLNIFSGTAEALAFSRNERCACFKQNKCLNLPFVSKVKRNEQSFPRLSERSLSFHCAMARTRMQEA